MLKTVLVAAVLSTAPLAAAAACGHERQQSATTCAAGQTWDATTQACVDTSA
jgi:hypothetical protein